MKESALTKLPPALRKIFGRRPVMVGEDIAAYDQFLEAVLMETNPQSIAEFLLSKDITDAEWELVRLHACKAEMVNVLIPDSLHFTGYYGNLDFPQASI